MNKIAVIRRLFCKKLFFLLLWCYICTLFLILQKVKNTSVAV